MSAAGENQELRAEVEKWKFRLTEVLEERDELRRMIDSREPLTQVEIASVLQVLRTAASRLWEHHRVGRELVVGETCEICRPERGVDVFSEIQGAKELLLTKGGTQ